MSNYVISCCSPTDLTREYFNERSVPLGYFKYTMDGKEYIDDMGETISPKEFYARIDAGSMPVTSQVNATEYLAMFEPPLQSGKDVLHITLSSGISGSYNSAKIAEEELRAKYPERKIYVIDSIAASAGYGLLVDTALDLRDNGASIDQLAQWLEENKIRLHHWFFTSDLKHFKRGGRVSATAAVMGSLLNICPVLNVDPNGKLIPRSKVRGKKNVIREMAELMKKHAEGGVQYNKKCFISHSACYEDAKALAELIEAEIKNIDGGVKIYDIGTTIGSHTGPGTVALFFWGDERVE